MNDINQFSFFKSYVDGLEKLKYEDSKRELVINIVYYIYYNKEPIWSKKEKEKKELIWTLILPSMNKSKSLSKNAKKKQE